MHFFSFSAYIMPPSKSSNELAAMDEKINMILAMLQQQQSSHDEMKSMLADSLKRVKVLEDTVTSLEAHSMSQDKEIKLLKAALNDRDQSARAKNLRLLGFPVGADEKATDGGKSFSLRIYNTLFKPILAAAVAKGDLDAIPACSAIIEKVYRIGKPADGSHPPPILVIFASTSARLAILRNKKGNTPAPSSAERDRGIKFYTMVEDLTTINHRFFVHLKAHDKVLNAWTIEGRIRFITRAEPNEIKKVKSVFESMDSIVL